MKNLKKITSMLIVIAMMLSLVSVGVFADDTNNAVLTVEYSKSSIGQNDEVIANFYLTADAKFKTTGLPAIYVNFDTANFTATVNNVDNSIFVVDEEEGLKEVVVGATQLKFTTTSKKTFEAGKNLLGSFKLTAKESATVKKYTLVLSESDTALFAGAGVTLVNNLANSTLSVAERATINSVTAPAAIADKELGTAFASLGLPKTLTVADATKDSARGGSVNVSWNEANYDPTVKTAQTINGTVATGNDFWSLADSFVQPTITVTLTAIAGTSADVASIETVEIQKQDTALTAVAIKAKLPQTVKVAKSGIEDTVSVNNWTVAPDATFGTVEDATLTATGTLANASKDEKFTFTDVTVTATVKIVPANIEGGSFELTDSTFVPNTKPAVKVTVPAAEVAKLKKSTEAEAESNRQIVAKIGDNETDVATDKFTDTEIDEARTAVAAAEAEGKDVTKLAPYTKTVTFSKSLSDLGYDTTDAKKAFTVSVTVGGTTLLAGKNEDGTVIETVGGTVVKPSSGGSSGSIGINKGNTTKTYAVTVVETKNGTATVSPEKAASGATVTVKPEPAEGYKVKSVTAVKADGTNVPVDEKAYTFTMPASAVKVTVEFEEGKDEPSVDPTPAEDKFADVADDFWAAKDIYTLKDAGIIGGKSATEFDPEGDVTRAEFAKMVVGLFGYKATSDAVNFEDCKAEDWFTPYVAAGVEAGVIKGVSDTEFAPNATITREDACTILGRALNKVAQSNELKFTDADKVAEYAAPYVALLSELGYVNGYEDGSFAPTNNITRAEAAKIIAGIYNAKDSTEDKADNTDTIDVAPEK